MNTEGSISSFFYNLIPGVLFIFGLFYLFDDKFSWATRLITKDNTVLITFLAIILGLFFGFIFQGIAKRDFFRKRFDEVSRGTVRNKNKLVYIEAKKEISRSIFGNKGNKLSQKKTFYLMYNYLRGIGNAETIMFFSERSSLWSNLFVGSSIYLLIFLISFFHKWTNISLLTDPKISVSLCVGNIVLIYFSFLMLVEHLRIFNETTLLTYITVIKHSKKVR